jgi:methionyl-tRNA formyltransferase
MKLRIAVLCSDGPHHLFLIRALQASFQVVTVIQEPAGAQRRRLWKLGRRRDYFWWTYHAVRRTLLGLDRYRSRFFLGDTSGSPNNAAGAVVVDDINGQQARNLVRNDRHNFTVIMGTRLLNSEMLAIVGQPAVNIHGGCLPHYRGNHCFFFALYNGDTDKLASTIHFVDEGTDTGNIVRHVPVTAKANQHPEELYCRAEKEAVLQLVELLKGVENGLQLVATGQAAEGRTYRVRDRTLRHDLRMWLRFRQPRFSPWLFRKGSD